jgi:hypothetical protein
MGAKVRADRRSQHAEPLVAVDPAPLDPELEADVRAAAVWFDALPAELQRYLDHEAVYGRGAYPAPKPPAT